MNKLIVGSGVAAGVVVLGVFGGYWHFAELLPKQQIFAPGEATDAAPEPAPVPGNVASGASEPAGVPAAPAVPQPEQAAPSPEPEAPDPVDVAAAPSIELLRVEPDGSTVVAGRAEPGSEVRLLSGGEVVASDRASPAGDFAIALDEPLPAGEHELSLQSAAEGGAVTPSADAALVSVPEPGREDELLVALGAPNEPTRFLARPAAPQGAGRDQASAAPPMQGEALQAAEPQAEQAEASEPQVAAVETQAEPAIEELRGAVGNGLSIAAVEIERDRIYVAGTARAGGQIRIYLDDIFIAQTQGSGEEFVAEARADVSVGSHRVRADEIGPDGTVVARVEVPFDRPEGESMAALAPGIVTRDNEPGAVQAPAAGPEAASTPATTTASQAAPAPEPEPAAAPAPVPGPAAAPAVQEPSQSASVTPVPPTRPEAASPDGAPLQTATVPEHPQTASVVSPQTPGEPPREPEEAAPESSAATATLRGSAEDASPAEALRTQAALRPVEGRVIIRRGDTLWRISRETYGLGRRYTTIYLANGDQIRDPDLIYPGQIFRLPEEESEDTSSQRG